MPKTRLAVVSGIRSPVLPSGDPPAAGQIAPAVTTASIAAVERDSGLSKDTLRVWERRYGFPKPQRGAGGERSYPLDQVEQLRLLKRLLDLGHRPCKIVGLTAEELKSLTALRSIPAAQDAGLASCVDHLVHHRADQARWYLSEQLQQRGLARFVLEIVAPLTQAVGDAWARGELSIGAEHLYTEAVQRLLRAAIAPLNDEAGTPRVLLTTFPQEPHGLGVLMAETMMTLAGAHCISLGVQTPIAELPPAAIAHRVDIVALSFSALVAPVPLRAGLAELTASLPRSVEVWVGGTNPALQRRRPTSVRTLAALTQIEPALADWRAARKRTA